MSPPAASMGSAKRSKKRKPIATPPESEETVHDTAATAESGDESEQTVHDTAADVESGEEMQESEQQEVAGDESEQTVHDTAADVESGEEMQESEQQEVAGDEEPVEAGGQDEEQANAERLQMGYCVVPSDKRFLVLHAFLKRKLAMKVMVVFSSCSSVKFHAELLSSLHLECADIHEKQKLHQRSATFASFCPSEKGILLCTSVAARGLDIPDLDYIVQYDPLDEPQDYIHNAEKGKGSVLLFVLPQELEFLISLRAANIRLTEYEFSNKNVPNLQARFEKIVGENYFLHQLAQEAYRAYILAYSSFAMKETFNVHGLNLKDVAASFFIRNTPKVNIDPESSAKRKVGGGGKRHRISATA